MNFAAPEVRSRKTLGFVGLGLLGSALAERALQAGFEVIGFDLNPARTALLARLGGKPASSASLVAARCRRMVFSLMTTDQVASVLKQMDDSLQPGSTVIDTTTGGPEQVTQVGRRLRRRGIHYLDAAIAGNSAEARAGQVLVLAGGDAKALKGCNDVFASFARRVYHLGPCGNGARMKLVFNLALGLHRAVLAEALTYAEGIGVSPVRALEIMKEGAAYSRVMDVKGEKMLRRDFAAQAKLEQHLKDVQLIVETGQGAGLKLPLSTIHRKLLAKLVRRGHGLLDNSAIIKAFE